MIQGQSHRARTQEKNWKPNVKKLKKNVKADAERKALEEKAALKAELEAKQREEAKAEAERIAKEKAARDAAELAAKTHHPQRTFNRHGWIAL